MSTLSVRIVGIAISVVATPMLVNGLGPSYFGILVTLTSLVAYLNLTDMGVGAGLLTSLGAESGRGDRARMADLVVNTAWILVGAGALVAALGVAASTIVDIPGLLGASPEEAPMAQLAYLIFVLGFAITIPLSIGSRVQAAMQRGSENAVWTTSATSLSAAVSAIVAWSTGSIVPTLAAATSANVIILAGQTARMVRQHPWVTSRGVRFRLPIARRLFGSAGWLLILQLAAVVSFQTDLVIVATLLGSEQAAVFNGALRLSSIIALATATLSVQFWPAAAEALATGETSWVRNTHRQLMWALPGVAAVGGAGLVLFGRPLIRMWLGPELVPPLSLLLAFAAWGVYNAAVIPNSNLLNAAGMLKQQVPFAILMAGANLALSLELTRRIGLAGPPLGSLLAHAVVALVPTLILVRRVTARP